MCINRRTVKLAALEARVLDALRTRLMRPEVYAAFVRGFTAEWNAAQNGRAVAQEGSRAELKRVEKSIVDDVRGVGESGGSAAVFAALKEAEARKATLEAELAIAEAPAPRLLPNLDALYREKVAALQAALEGEYAAAARGLIDEVRVAFSSDVPKAPPAIEVRGAPAAMLGLGSGQGGSGGALLGKQMKVVAGAGFEPAAFRL